MRILFTGSRDWDDWLTINEVFTRLNRLVGSSVAIHGGARGVDLYIGVTAEIWGWEQACVRPNYACYGRYVAPKRRNITMLEMQPDLVVGFWDGRSTGTAHCLDFAVNVFRIPTIIFGPRSQT